MHLETLFPFDCGGKAEMLISATELISMGRRTNEFTIGITVSERPEANSRDGLFLLHAYNSSRIFAWVERTFFRTPYRYGRIEFEHRLPAKVRVDDQQGHVAQMGMGSPTIPAIVKEEWWQGPIYLPRRHATFGRPGEFFVAKLGGETDLYPFQSEIDWLLFSPRHDWPIFRHLVASGVAGKEWRIRFDAVHARSRTFAI